MTREDLIEAIVAADVHRIMRHRAARERYDARLGTQFWAQHWANLMRGSGANSSLPHEEAILATSKDTRRKFYSRKITKPEWKQQVSWQRKIARAHKLRNS